MTKVYIYLDYSNDKYTVLQPRCLLKGYDVMLVKDISKLNTRNCCIIGTNVEFQYNIFKNINNFDYYNLFDDKSGFYNYLKSNVDIWSNLYLIPSYDNTYHGPNINKKFMVKKNNGYSSAFNEIITGNIQDIIKKYSPLYQIQDVMDVKHIYGVRLLYLGPKLIAESFAHDLDFVIGRQICCSVGSYIVLFRNLIVFVDIEFFKTYFFVVAQMPLYSLVLFGCYAMMSIGYHLLVLEDCTEAEKELRD